MARPRESTRAATSRSSTSFEPSISSRLIFAVQAEADLASIFEWTSTHFSERQARVYIDGLERALERLLEFPGIAPRYAGLSGRYRVKRYCSHLVYYRGEGDDILIVRILHVRRDAPATLA